MSRFRSLELRQCLGFARTARKALAAGDLRRAFRHHLLATRSLSLARAFGGGNSVTATGTLCRVLTGLADRIEDALIPPPQVEAWELVPHLFEALQVLQRKGVEVADELLLDRARNAAMQLAGIYRITAIDRPSEDCPQPPQSGEVGAN